MRHIICVPILCSMSPVAVSIQVEKANAEIKNDRFGKRGKKCGISLPGTSCIGRMWLWVAALTFGIFQLASCR